LYSRDQLEQLKLVAGQVAAGFSPADAHRVLADRLVGGLLGRAPLTSEHTRILVVERDAYAAELTEYFLLAEGYEVILAMGADDALTMVTEHAVDVTIVDLLISGAHGLDLCVGLCERGLPVVAISTFDSADAASEAGASAFLRKPIEPTRLVSTIRELLGRSARIHREPVRR